MRILQLTSHFSPNVGGVETHLDDLVSALAKRGHQVFVLTYRPLTAKVKWKFFERRKNTEILRLPWIPGLFYKLVSHPILEFFYLSPGLFLVLPIILLAKSPEVIHAHGLVAGAVGVVWGKIFGKRVVISTHSIYHFPKSGAYRNFVKWILNSSDFSLGLSNQAAKEIKSLGIDKRKVGTFTYWIYLEKFKKIARAKEKLGWKNKFIVLFIGRLVREKGIVELLKSVGRWDKNINLVIVGTGPLEERVRQEAGRLKNLVYLGGINNKNLPIYYSSADLLIVPSIHEEGFGRVILESLACGTPVIGARRGAIPEAMDKSVGKLIKVTPKNIKNAVEYFYKNPDKLEKLSRNARKFAVDRYSEKNVEKIIKAYKTKT